MPPKLTRWFWIIPLLFVSKLAVCQFEVSSIGKSVLPAIDKLYYVSEDPSGFFWIGSKLGLFRFDGATVKQFYIQDESSGIKHDQSLQSPVFTDVRNRLWFTTPNALHQFNPETEKFTTLQVMLGDQVMNIDYHLFHYDPKKDELWLSAGKHLWAYHIPDQSYRRLGGPTSAHSFAVSPDQQYILGATWNIKMGVEVFKLNGQRKYFTKSQLLIPSTPSFVLFHPVDSIAYAGTNKGLVAIRINPDTITYEELTGGIPPFVANFIATSPSGEIIWSADKQAGVRGFNIKSRQYEYLLTQADGLSTNSPNYLSVTAGPKLWVSHNGVGIDIVKPRTNKELITVSPDTGVSSIADISAGPAGDIHLLNVDGRQWTGTLNERQELIWQEIAPLPATINERFVKDAAKQTIISSKAIFTVGEAGQVQEIYQRREDARYHVFGWSSSRPILLTQRGVMDIRMSTDSIVESVAPEFAEYAGNYFSGLFTLTDSTFMLGYESTEVWFCKKTEGQLVVLHKVPLIGNLYTALSSGTDGAIYIGTSTGLYRFRNNQLVLIVNNWKGITNLRINSLTQDTAGRIFAGTNIGLMSYTPATDYFLLFTEEDGLPDNQFAQTPPVHLQDGSILMLTQSGLIRFSPEKLHNSQSDLKPYVSDIWVNNIPYEDTITTPRLSRLSFPFRQSTLFFKIALAGLEQTTLAGINYQLEGIDDQPVFEAAGHTIRYPNLPPGEYTLHLTAINRNGQPSGEQRLAIVIRPPFYQTWPFYLACTCALALIAAGLYITGLRRERLKQQRLHEQQARLAAERDRIAGEVHDDLGGQISSILYLSEEMLMTGIAPDNERELHRIHELSRHSLQNVRDIIFALDNRRATLADLGEQLRGAGEAFFGDRKIEFHCTDALTRPAFELTSRQKRNLTLIVKEAWHNIAKHARATEVTVDLQEESDLLRITIADNGVGFTDPRSANGMGGFGLENMQEKATVIGGSLAIDSGPGQGTRLTLNWPITN